MFAFAIGLLLPVVNGRDALSSRIEALRDLELELSKRLALAPPELALLIWWHRADGSSPPQELLEHLASLESAHRGLKIVEVATLPGGLERWLVTSQVVVQLALPEWQSAEEQRAGSLLLERRLAHSLPSWSTLVQHLHPNADQSARWQRFRGNWELAPEAEHYPLVELQRSLVDFHSPSRGATGPNNPAQLISAEAMQTQRGSSWAQRKAERLLQRSDHLLWLQAACLALLLAVVRQGLDKLVPELLLLMIGVWFLSRQPLRKEAQQWWTLADVLWIQDLWHRFGLGESPTDWLPTGRSLPPSAGHGFLDGIAWAHQLRLWLEAPAAPWQRPQLVDAIEALRARHELLATPLQRHGIIRQMMIVVLSAMAALMAATVLLNGQRWPEQLILVLAVVAIALWLSRPLPLVDAERLKQHLLRLETTRLPLLSAQAQEQLDDPMLRQSVALAIRRVGAEVLDLCGDALQSVRAQRRVFP